MLELEIVRCRIQPERRCRFVIRSANAEDNLLFPPNEVITGMLKDVWPPGDVAILGRDSQHCLVEVSRIAGTLCLNNFLSALESATRLGEEADA